MAVSDFLLSFMLNQVSFERIMSFSIFQVLINFLNESVDNWMQKKSKSVVFCLVPSKQEIGREAERERERVEINRERPLKCCTFPN